MKSLDSKSLSNGNCTHANGAAVVAAGMLFLATSLFAGTLIDEMPGDSNSRAPGLTVLKDGRLLTVIARDLSTRDILDEISKQIDLRIYGFAPLDEIVTLEIAEQPLSVVLSRVLRGHSYQLYQLPSRANLLWVFSEGRLVDSAQIQMLENDLLHGDKRTRRNAVIALRKIGSMEAIGPLSFALTDADPDISIRAVYALAEIGGNDALTALASASADADSWVRSEAAAALASIGGEAAVSHLKQALHDPDRNTRAAIIASLADNPGESSSQVLAITLQDPDPLIRMEAVDALEEIGGQSALRVLSQAESNQDADVKFAIDETLSALDGSE